MQRSISLIVSPGFSLEALTTELREDCRFRLSVEYDDFTIRRSEAPDRYVFISCNLSLQNLAIEDYQDNPELDPEFREVVSERVVYSFLSNSAPLLRDVLEKALDNMERLHLDAWMDDDHGKVARGSVVSRRLREKPDWDLRLG